MAAVSIMKRLFVVSGIFHPDVGGPATYLMHLLTALSEHQLAKITVVTYGEDQNTYPFDVVKISRKWPIPIRLLLFTIACLRHGWTADLWFVNDYGLPPTLANLLLHKPVVMKVVGDFSWEFARSNGLINSMGIDEFQGYRGSAIVRLLKKIQRYYVSRADLVVTPSCYLQRIIMGWGVPSDKIAVVYNALDPEPFAAAVSQEEARLAFRIPVGRTVLLTIARLAPWKNVDQIIERVAKLDDSYLYVIAGEGPEMDRLQQLARTLRVQDRIIFLGQVPRDQVPTLLKSADIFVLNSSYEGLPHVILEAAAAGIPSLIADQEGCREAVEMAKSGFVMGDNFSDDIRQALTIGSIKLPEEFTWEFLFRRMSNILELGK
jgi:glycosyltransferase involved in cell wall biosynthesis